MTTENPGDAVLYSVADGVATLTMNRPESMNALDDDVQDGLANGLLEADRDRNVGCVVIAANGRGFCGGGNVKGMASRDAGAESQVPRPGSELESWEDAANAARRMHDRIVMRLYELSKPTIAVVNGAAAGAGVGLACACDVRIVSERAFFVTSFGRVGRSGDFGTSFFLRQLVGPSMLRQLYFTGERVDARKALELGIANAVHPEDRVLEEAQALARQIASGPRRAQARMKQVFRAADAGDLRQVLEMESMFMTLSGRSAEGRHFLQEFLSSRQSK